MFSTVFFHWMYKMKYSCYQESSVIHGWFVYWAFKVNLSNAKKCGLFCFPRICFRSLIYCDQEPLWLLNVIEDVCYFLGVHIFRLSTRCKMFHSKITYLFPQKSHERALNLTDLWITSSLFDLKYKFINGSFTFSPG